MGPRVFALGAAGFFATIAVFALVPGAVSLPIRAPEMAVVTNYGYLFGLFAVNICTTALCAVVAAAGAVAFGRPAWARGYARGLAWLFSALALLGLLPRTHTLFGVLPLFDHDVWLHGVIALAAGVASAGRESALEASAAEARGERSRRAA